jgi:ferredoxin-NADP reductase
LRRIEWRMAEVLDIRSETSTVKTLVLRVPEWPGHLPGEHVDVRLTAEDGYQAQRSYSIASAPDAERIELTVERLADGEVSPYLTDELRAGDPLELRGPIGGYFVWTVADGGPLFLVAGGSGIVPLMAMLRHRAAAGSEIARRTPAVLLYSSRSYEQIIYRAELEQLASAGDGLQVTHTLTRAAPVDWSGRQGRIDRKQLAATAPSPAEHPHIYICGPTPLVETAANLLVELGHDPARVRTERFGPTGA